MAQSKPTFLDIQTIRKAHGNPELISSIIRMTGITLTGLSLRFFLSEGTVRQSIHNPTCPVGDGVIVSYLNTFPSYKNLTAYDLWPERYQPDGTRSIGRHSTPAKAPRHRQKTEAA